jgi:precorrin-2 dehydrogenase / sirohydrochlorin ferrochelatase
MLLRPESLEIRHEPREAGRPTHRFTMTVYPIFLNNLTDRRCVVVGGDHEGERKADELAELGADVTVISAEATSKLRALADEGRITWLARDYRPGDLRDAFLVIVSETNPEATAPIWEEAQAEKVLINAMDDVPHCTFVAGSVVRRGPLVVSISTSGAAPALSVRLRQQLEKAFGPEYETFLTLMERLRGPMAERYPEFQERRRLWYELVDSNVLSLLAEDRPAQARRRIEEITGIGIEWELKIEN